MGASHAVTFLRQVTESQSACCGLLSSSSSDPRSILQIDQNNGEGYGGVQLHDSGCCGGLADVLHRPPRLLRCTTTVHHY